MLTDLDNRLLRLLKTILEDDSLDDTVSQDSCETWDSLHHLQLIVAIEEEFDVVLEPEEIAVMQDFNSIKEVLSRKN